MKTRIAPLAAVMLLCLLGPRAVADTIWVGSGGANALELKNVTILRVLDEKLYFRSVGNETSRELSKVVKLKADDDPALTAAEEAFAAGTFDKAVDGYLKVVRASKKEWAVDWSSLRLIESANKTGRFDAAVTAYVNLVLKDPDLATKYKPQMPDEKSTYLESASSEVKKAMADLRLNEDKKMALQSFLLEIERLRGNTEEAGKIATALSRTGAAQAVAADDPAAKRRQADLKLQVAKLALDSKDYSKALRELEGSRAVFIEPKHQAEALFCIAEARSALASVKNEPKELQDAALAYMRVVAHFRDTEGMAPRVAESLYKTAEILEKLDDSKSALQLYQSVAQYTDAPAAVKAKESIARLKNQPTQQ